MSGPKTHNPFSREEKSKQDVDDSGRGSITRRGFLRGADSPPQERLCWMEFRRSAAPRALPKITVSRN